MSDLIDTAFGMLNTELATHLNETVTYAQGASSGSVSAIWNKSRSQFDILKSDLVVGGTTLTPQHGDTITRAGGEVYDVTLEFADENGVMVADYDVADSSNTVWLISVQKVQS